MTMSYRRELAIIVLAAAVVLVLFMAVYVF
jgi:hypothetical protein